MAGKLTEALKAGKSDVFQQVTKHLSPAVGKFSVGIWLWVNNAYILVRRWRHREWIRIMNVMQCSSNGVTKYNNCKYFTAWILS